MATAAPIVAIVLAFPVAVTRKRSNLTEFANKVPPQTPRGTLGLDAPSWSRGRLCATTRPLTWNLIESRRCMHGGFYREESCENPIHWPTSARCKVSGRALRCSSGQSFQLSNDWRHGTRLMRMADAWAVHNAAIGRRCDAKPVGHWRRGRSTGSLPLCCAASSPLLCCGHRGAALGQSSELTNYSAGVGRRAGSPRARHSFRQPPMIHKSSNGLW
jgi:hypothetical protein